MLAELRLELESDCSELGYYQSSNLQGVLMQHIDCDYAEQLHMQSLNPYSQHMEITDKKIWCISVLNEEAYRYIIEPLLKTEFQEFSIEKKDIHVRIKSKELRTKSKRELLSDFYDGQSEKYLTLQFMTPTAFKSNGRYVIIPEVRYIYQSLMNKYSAVSKDMDMYDEETLEQLETNSVITGYRLSSTSFPLEGVRIPSFKGEITIRINGTGTMARFARFLAEFGEYSGVGIKTAMGMGAIRIKERRRNNDR